MWTYVVLGLLCLFGLSYSEDDVQQLPQRSCDLNQGVVCIPTACSGNVCSLWKNATCVTDRCGCEARFFNWMAKEKTYHDVSKMCSSGNFVINFLKFVTATDKMAQDEDAPLSIAPANVPSDAMIVKYFREFNLLTTEILMDIADYLKIVSQTSPTRANIEKLSSIRRTLSSLKQLPGSINDEGSLGKDNLDAAKKGYKATLAALENVVSDEGTYADAVASGKVAISNGDARNKLKETLIQARKVCLNVGSFSVGFGC